MLYIYPKATGQQQMTDVDHSIDFWKGVATTFKHHSQVIFDLYNEPYISLCIDPEWAWKCWKVSSSYPSPSPFHTRIL